MSGTHQIDGVLFPQDPIEKQWARRKLANKGTKVPVYSPVWTYSAQFGTLETQGENDFFMSHYLNGGLHSATLPHPFNGSLTTFTGVSIEEVSFRWNDVDRNYWAIGSRVVFGNIRLNATGT